MELAKMPINTWMDKETLVYIHNEVLFSHQEEWNCVIWMKIDWTGDHLVNQNKSDLEKHHIFFHMLKLVDRNKRGCHEFRRDTIYVEKRNQGMEKTGGKGDILGSDMDQIICVYRYTTMKPTMKYS